MSLADRGWADRLLTWPVVTLFVVALMGVGLWLALWSPLFDARDITVSGNERVPSQRILRLAAIDPSTNVLLLSLGGVRERLTADPWIADARVERDLPSTVTIAVVERRETAAIKDAGGWVILAEDGTALDTASGAKGLPEIQGTAPPPVGERDEGSTPAATLLGAMTPDAVAEVDRVVVDGGLLEVRLRSGGRVTLGEATELQQKADALSGIVAWANENGSKIKTADLTTPEAPAAKVSGGTYSPAP